jgi:uncharacterized repeat protein (TIGR01451 family)
VDPLEVSVGELPVGGEVAIAFQVLVDDPVPAGVTEIANQGAVAADGLADVLTDDPDAGGDADPTVTAITAAPVLVVEKSDLLFSDAGGDGEASPGDELLYTITVENTGNTGATAVRLADSVPANAALVPGTVQTSQGTVASEDPVDVDLGELAAGATATVTFRVTVDDPFPAEAAEVVNQATVTSAELEPVPSDDPDTEPAGDATATSVFVAPDVAIDDVTVSEGDPGAAVEAVLTVTLSRPSNRAVTVAYETAAASALAGTDYESSAGELVFAPGETSQALTVPVLPDLLDELDETFTVALTSAAGGVLVDGEGLVTILDDDPPPQVAISGVTVNEADGQAIFAATLSAASSFDVTLEYSTAEGTALAGADYEATAGAVVIPAGGLAASILVPILDDALDEDDESFIVQLTNATNSVLAVALATGTIVDDDAPPEVSIGDVTVAEGTGTPVDAVFALSLSSPSGREVSVDYQTIDGTAVSGADYAAASGTVVFPAGVTTRTVTIEVLGDAIDELDETFVVRFSDPVHVTVSDAEGAGTIHDDDDPPIAWVFTDGTAAAGLGTPGVKNGGLALCDFDSDGDLDALVNTGTSNGPKGSHLYFNDGSGVFTEVTATHAPGLLAQRGQRSAICADVDNDGDLDFARNDHNRVEIWLNRGPLADPPYSFGTAADGPSQVWTSIPGGMNTEGMAWLDYDLDGDLDLILDNHDFGIDLFENDGSGHLSHATPVGGDKGLPQTATTGDYSASGDVDGDGRVDFLDRKEGRLDLWRNLGGSFAAEASLDEEARDSNKGGVAFCDFDADGDFDVAWTDAGTTRIWTNDDGAFTATAEPGASSGVDLSAEDVDGVACPDVDNDGDLDLFLSVDGGPSHLFFNRTPAGGALSFVRDNREIDVAGDGEGLAFGDVDRDGDLDLLINRDDAPNQLWVSHANDGQSEGYLYVRALRCLAPGVFRDDVGATLRLYQADGATPASPLVQASGGRGHGSQDPAWVHFGLPLGEAHDYFVEVRFQGGDGLPGDPVLFPVRPADLAGFHLVTVNDCGAENTPPTAFDRQVGFEPGTPVSFTLRAVDPEGQPLTFTVVTSPLHGSLSGLPPHLTYTPDPGFAGRDELVFTAGDGELDSAPAVVTLQAPLPDFTEVAAGAGVDVGGAKEGGLSWCDFDADGWPDLLVNTAADSSSRRSRLLANNRNGTFTDVTASHAAGLTRRLGRRSAVCADVDGDGHLDLARNEYNRVEVYLNRGPQADPPFSFGDAGQEPSQVITAIPGGMNTEGMGWIDFDGDGDLDLMLENDGFGIDLFVNDGSGQLVHGTPNTDPRGLPTATGVGDYLAVADYDADGFADAVGRKRDALDLYRNQGDGTFAAVASFDEQADGSNKGAAAFCDFDADGDLDVFWTDAGVNQVWRNDAGVFSATGEPAASSGVAITGGVDDTACGDVDNDGDLDLFLSVASGPGYLFLNDTAAGSSSAWSFRRDNLGVDVGGGARSAAFADADRDGDLDLAVNVEGANQLWLSAVNDASPGGGDYLAVRALICLPGGGYRDAVGATVRLLDDDGVTPVSPLMEVSGGRGHGSQDAAVLHFGLARADRLVVAEARFPGAGGAVEQVAVVPAEIAGYRLVAVKDCGEPDLAPRAFDGGAEAAEPVVIELQGSDPESAPLTFTVVTPPAQGELEVLTDLSSDGSLVRYTPAPGGTGDDAFTFRVGDGRLDSAAATVTITRPLPELTEGAAASGVAVGGAKEGGLAWCDFNGDGWPDLLVNTMVNSASGRSRLLYNLGDGTFADVTASHAAGLTRKLGRRSAICADVDNDGDLDFARNEYNRVEIYLNRGAAASPPYSFGDAVQDPSQVITSIPGGMNTEGLAWIDFDNDGDLDLMLENDSFGIDLYANDGAGVFTHATPDSAPRGLPVATGVGDYLAVGDYDADGFVDALGRKTGGVDLYRNRGDETFEPVPSLDGQADGANKGGVAFCDLDSDGDLDAFWTDAGENQIWRNDGGVYAATGQPAASAGVALGGDVDGVACADVDNDGDLDLFLAASSGPGYLLFNDTAAGGALTFHRDNLGIDVGANGEAVAFADPDRDGDLDLVVNVDGGANQLWVGHVNDGGADAYLAVRALRCVGGDRYRDDVGATVRLLQGDGVTPAGPLQEVNGGRGHGSQSPAQLHFGLPSGKEALYVVEVRFLGAGGGPGGLTTATVIPADLPGYQLLEIRDTGVCP